MTTLFWQVISLAYLIIQKPCPYLTMSVAKVFLIFHLLKPSNMTTSLGSKQWLSTVFACILMAIASQINAQNNDDTSKGPFFIVKAEKYETELLPLKSTDVAINIAGVMADITISQEYINTGDQKLEAIYIFPASTRAAVYGLEMEIGGRKIEAKIAEKYQARREYEEAKAAGKTATLLEQHRPNVFQMSVGHILPGDRIVVKLRYTELLIPEEGVYELAFPTVVGPRYADDFTEGLADANTWVNNPYLPEGEGATYNYSIQTSIQAGMTIHQVSSPSHKVEVQFEGKDKAKIILSKEETRGGTKDYILRYRLGGKQLQSGLLLFEGETENFFLAMIQPPQMVEQQQMPPREYIFILDVSGSMRGFPLEISKEMVRDMAEGLRPQDRFNVMLFESGNVMLAPKSVPANKSNIAEAMELMDKLQGGGGTELLPALKVALKMPDTEGFSRSFVIITDGFISVEQEAFDVIRENLGNANIFAVGAGSSVNRFLIEGIARCGQGEPLVVTTPEEAKLQAKKFSKYIASPALTNIEIDFGGATVYDVSPLSVPDVMAERPVVIYGKYKGKPSGNISLQGITGQKKYVHQMPWTEAKPTSKNSAIRYLWARNEVATLNDYTNLNPSLERVKQITQLGIDYNLLTNYTSFIAIDPVSREKSGQEISVKQALPLPKGVQGSAVQIAGNVRGTKAIVSRDIAEKNSEEVYLGMPEKQKAFAGKASIAWTPVPSETSYAITISDLVGQVLWTKETENTVVDIDLKEDALANAMGNALLIEVKGLTTKKISPNVMLQLMKGPETAAFLQQFASLLLAEGLEAKLSLAQQYTQMGMYANALGALREAIAMDKDNKALNAYNALIQEMGI